MLALLLFCIPGLVIALSASLGVELCPTRSFGLTCPGCGLGGASLMILRGEWIAAHLRHPLVIPTVALAGLGWLSIVFEVVGHPWERALPLTSRPVIVAGTGIGMGLILVWVARLAGFIAPLP